MNLSHLLIGVIAGYLFIIFYEMVFYYIRKKIRKKPVVRFEGYHLHHSLYGLACLFLYIIKPYPFLLGFGLGIIIRHTQVERKFIFVGKS